MVREISLTDHLKGPANSSISNLNWSTFKRRSERHLKRESTETSTPTPIVSASPEKGISGLFTGTSKRNGIEEAPNENTAGPISIDGVKPESPGSTAFISDYSKHNPINIGMPLSSPAKITPDPSPDNSISAKSREQKTR
jgi:hypothetical protein